MGASCAGGCFETIQEQICEGADLMFTSEKETEELTTDNSATASSDSFAVFIREQSKSVSKSACFEEAGSSALRRIAPELYAAVVACGGQQPLLCGVPTHTVHVRGMCLLALACHTERWRWLHEQLSHAEVASLARSCPHFSEHPDGIVRAAGHQQTILRPVH